MESHANATDPLRAAARRVARVVRLLAAIPFTCALLNSPATAADVSALRVPKPVLATPSGDKCVDDPAFMRRNHPDLLRHQRAQTVHEGIRAQRYSLANCVSCHASRQTGRVTGSADAFCESCHRYASVKLDCFECHSDRPQAAVAAAAPTTPAKARP
jgi:hypothetical protein